MRFTSATDAEAERRLHDSIYRLAEKKPEFSAVTMLTKPQQRGLIGVAMVFLVALLASPDGAGIAFVAIATVVYVLAICNRLFLFKRSLGGGNIEVVSDEEARAVPVSELPVYTVLVPAYQEPEVLGTLLGHICDMEYPQERLDVKVLLEADDQVTIAAVHDLDIGDFVEVVLVPPASPRTKPKALNYGLSLARGDIVTIYDAEDQPDPLQLRRAAVALARLGPEVACIQAKLSYSNGDQNLITKWFTIEYAMWFSLFLPGLVSIGAPIPLGGTSNHFRRSVLERMDGWDPHNVTEDADLGIRFARNGYSVRILESVTLEEANSDFVNWIKQRSRWYKGYLQTYMIHMRHPRSLVRELGWKAVIEFTLFVGATPILAVLNGFFWAMTIVWFIGHPHFIKAVFPAPVFYLGILCWSLGNFSIAYFSLLTCRVIKRPELLWAALLVPVYWVMMSIAAVKAVVQFVYNPSFWEKTMHGLGHAQNQQGKAAGGAKRPTVAT